MPPDPDRTNAGGVLPETGPVRTATIAEKIVGGVQRSWGMTLGAVGGSVFLGVFGMWLVGKGHPVFGVMVMGAIIPLTFTALFIRKAPCPACQTSITVIGIDRCGSCGAYVHLDGPMPVLCEPGFIAPLATFEADVPLPVIPRIVWPQDGYCVVCGERAGAGEERLDIQGNIIPIPHCGEHQDGVVWAMGISQTAVTIIKLKFRSYSYWQEFMAANEVHTRAGMWR